jgi:prefoldin subunit 5
MSGKITDARIEHLRSLRDRRDKLSRKIEKEKEGMQAVLDSMDEVTQDSTQSSSRAAKEKRAKEKDRANFSHDDAVEIHQMAIERLKEDYAQVVKELEDLEQLMNA